MFEVSVRGHFSAAHHLAGHPGKCARQHGHNWEVEVFLRGEQLNDTGILADFGHLKEALRARLSELDHLDLNILDDFAVNNPTSENIARFLYAKLSSELDCARYKVRRVSVREGPWSQASYWE